MKQTDELRATITPDEFYKMMGCGRNKGYDLIREHNLGIRVGRRIVIPRVRLERFLEGDK